MRVSSVVNDIRDGLRTVLQISWLWITIAVLAVVNLALGGTVTVSLPFLARRTFQSGVDVLGLLFSALALGAVAAAFALGRLPRISQRGVKAYGALIASGVMGVLIGLVPSLWITLLAIFIIGATLEGFNLIWYNAMQELVPREKLGRVSSIDDLGSFVFLPLGFSLAGFATDMFGAPTAFLLSGIVVAGVAGIAISNRAIRSLN